MRKILVVAVQEMIVNIRRPGYIIMTLLIPALGLVSVLIASLFGGQVGKFLETQLGPSIKATGYVDESGLISSAPSADSGEEYVRFADEPSARTALLAKEIDAYFVVPSDYLATGRVMVYSTRGGFSTLTAVENSQIGRWLVERLLAGKVDPAILARVAAPFIAQPISLNSMGEVSSESPFNWVGDFVLPYAFSILFIVTLFTTSGFLLQGVSEEKEGRIIEILVSSISPTQLLAGKILGLGIVGLIQVLVWIGSGGGLVALSAAAFAMAGVIKMSVGTVLLGVVYFVMGYLVYAILMAVAGSLGTTQRESQQIGGIFTLAAALPWFFISVIFTNPGAPIAVALSYIPLTSPVMMLMRLGFGQVPWVQIAISLVLLAGAIVLCLWAGAKIFRMGILMYGKRPGLRELVLAFKQA